MMQGLFIEMRSAVKDIRGSTTDWRRLGLRVLPVAAAATAGAGALCVKKRLDPPTADFLGQKASFQCQKAEASAEQRLEALGVDVSALRRAARRLRGPLERDLAAAALRARREGTHDQLYGGLVEEWRAAGYLSEPLERQKPRLAYQGIDPISQMDESYGRDVGCEVPLCLLRGSSEARETGEFRTLAPEDWASAAEALSAHGTVLLRGLLPHSQVQALRGSLGVQCSVLDRARSSEGFVPVREYDASVLQESDPELEPVTSTPGRRHFYLRGRALEEVVREVQAGAMPLVWEHLVRTGGGTGRRPYVSEVQLIISDPCATDQFWHIDNSSPGVTLFVPLTPVPEDLGPTLFMPGSHHLFAEDSLFQRWRRFAFSFLSSEGVAVGAMGPGDALVYDSRIVHRGAANRRYDRTRVALIFRYDFERPPGLGSVGTQLLSWTGNVLAAFQRCYSALPGGGTPAAAAPA